MKSEAKSVDTRIIFEVEATEGIEANVDLMKKVLVIMPMDSGAGVMYNICDSCLQMVENDCFNDVLALILRIFVKFLLMKKPDLKKYLIDDEKMGEMKSALKKSVIGNRKLELEVTKEFSISRPMMNRYNALFK